MTIDIKGITKVAKLARISLNDSEKEHMANELNGIIKWVEQLGEVNTDGVPQMFGHSGMTLPMREDVVSDGGIQQDVLSNAPNAEYGCFAVPKVIE